ncbi:hypothetical protein ACH347_35400 [Saccharopolyspora sp. 5N102]|uniref:hypothetical protein n=1 Tax=Saccharopolyspora sp. 5N102 TaxID=3375155 RepID=UPI0037932719
MRFERRGGGCAFAVRTFGCPHRLLDWSAISREIAVPHACQMAISREIDAGVSWAVPVFVQVGGREQHWLS